MSPLVTPDLLKARLKDLPALPAVVAELITSIGNDTVTSDDIAAKLSKDLALSAKTLRMANSSFYGMSRQIETIQEAVTVLGLRTVRNLVIAGGLTSWFTPPASTDFNFHAFWRHAIGAALCGQALAQEIDMDADMGFTVGLLHDIGQMTLSCCFPDEYTQVLLHRQTHDCMLIDAELAVLGTDHAAIGGQIAEHWRFSPVVVEAIAHHHAPAMHHGPGLVGLTHMADALSHGLGLSGLEDEYVPITPPAIWAAMSPKPDAFMQLFAKVENQFECVCQALQI